MITDKPMPSDGLMHIDLSGPEGNAFVLIGITRKILKQLGHEADYIDDVQKQMTSGKYEHLLEVMDNHVGEYVVLHQVQEKNNDGDN